MRTVVVQVERCEVVLLVGYRPGTGEATDELLRRAASPAKSQGLDTLRTLMSTQAMAPLAVTIDHVALLPTKVRAKIGLEPGGARPMVVLLVTYALPRGKTLAISSRDPRSTRISWTDRDSHRVVISDAPAQGRWYPGVASFLLSLSARSITTGQSPAPGDSPCVSLSSSPSSSSAR